LLGAEELLVNFQVGVLGDDGILYLQSKGRKRKERSWRENYRGGKTLCSPPKGGRNNIFSPEFQRDKRRQGRLSLLLSLDPACKRAFIKISQPNVDDGGHPVCAFTRRAAPLRSAAGLSAEGRRLNSGDVI